MVVESRYFNNLLHFISQDERFYQEMPEAKREFQRFAGAILESDREYQARINSFHNWYILDRPLRRLGITPLEYFLQFNANTLMAEDLEGYRELRDNVHSVFELLKRSRTQTWVRDLLTKRKYAVEGSEETDHVDPGTLFNTRLFFHKRRVYFSNYLVPHPDSVTRIIKSHARKARKARGGAKDFIYLCVLFQSRWDQYRQFDPLNIYRFDAAPRRPA